MKSLTIILLGLIITAAAYGQRGSATLFGDVKIDETGLSHTAPPKVMIILYKDVGGEVGRQSISNGSRYTFTNLQSGEYQLAIEVDNNEITRMRVTIQGLSNDPHGFRQDLEFGLKNPERPATSDRVVSASDVYKRPAATRPLFEKAEVAASKKNYDQAAGFLKQIVDSDAKDFQAWTLLGTVYLLQENSGGAEKAYLAALEANPKFALALIDLGRLRSSQKKYAEALEPLSRAVELQPQSGETNLLLGEAYIQLKKGSKAIPYLNAAAQNGKPEAHLRLGWLYNAAGLKEKAVIEYEEFLKKQPNYPDRKKLEDYIAANKKM